MSWGDPTCSFLYYLYCTHVQLLKVRLLWLFGAIEAGSCRACFSFEQPDGMLHQNTFNHQKSRDILPRKIALEDTLSRWLDPTVLTVSYQSFLIHELIELPQPLDTSSWNPSTFPSTKDPRTHGWCSKTVVKRLVIWDGQFGELMQVRSSEMFSICRCLLVPLGFRKDSERVLMTLLPMLGATLLWEALALDRRKWNVL